jgi:hypothetical protein
MTGHNRKLESCRTRHRDRQASNRRACSRSGRSHTSTNCSHRCKSTRCRLRERCPCRCSSPPGSCHSYDRRRQRWPGARAPRATTGNGSSRTLPTRAQYPTEVASRLALVAKVRHRASTGLVPHPAVARAPTTMVVHLRALHVGTFMESRTRCWRRPHIVR